MKMLEEFLNAANNDQELMQKIRLAVREAGEDMQARVDALVRLARENGYDVSVEDFAAAAADGQELDEKELLMATGGGRGYDEGLCWGDFLCIMSWNNCNASNECPNTNICDNSVF